MTTVEQHLDHHLAAWRDGDPEAVAAAVASFTDPDTGAAVGGEALVEHARAFLARFPGTFEFERIGDTAVSWTLTAAHREAYLGMPGTGADVVITGVDVLVTDADGTHVRRVFDRVAVGTALGYQPRFVPPGDADRAFGVSSRAPGRPGTPGVITLTYLDVHDTDEGAEVDLLSDEVVKSLRASKGFLGVGTFDVGNRKYTITAFDRPESVRAIHARAHQRVMRRFFRGGLCTGAYTSVWSLERESHFARCTGCGAMTAAGKTCDCGWTPTSDTLF